jgi:hypothetical protein
MEKAMKPDNADLAALCRSRPELERLLQRLAVLVPIVHRQQCDANLAAERAYFEDSGKATPEATAMWREHRMMAAGDFMQVPYPHGLDTPEWRELRSIGLAVAAFGGTDAISEMGYAVGGDHLWHQWDGMAGHWL